MFKKSKEIADDKVNIAVNTYEMIDKHIRKLDSDLAKFESEMKVMIDWSKALLSSSVVNILAVLSRYPESLQILIPPISDSLRSDEVEARGQSENYWLNVLCPGLNLDSSLR